MEDADGREDEAMLREPSVMFMGHFQERSRLRLPSHRVLVFYVCRLLIEVELGGHCEEPYVYFDTSRMDDVRRAMVH